MEKTQTNAEYALESNILKTFEKIFGDHLKPESKEFLRILSKNINLTPQEVLDIMNTRLTEEEVSDLAIIKRFRKETEQAKEKQRQSDFPLMFGVELERRESLNRELENNRLENIEESIVPIVERYLGQKFDILELQGNEQIKKLLTVGGVSPQEVINMLLSLAFTDEQFLTLFNSHPSLHKEEFEVINGIKGLYEWERYLMSGDHTNDNDVESKRKSTQYIRKMLEEKIGNVDEYLSQEKRFNEDKKANDFLASFIKNDVFMDFYNSHEELGLDDYLKTALIMYYKNLLSNPREVIDYTVETTDDLNKDFGLVRSDECYLRELEERLPSIKANGYQF